MPSFLPWQLAGILLRERLDLLPSKDQVLGIVAHLTREHAMHRIVLEQVRERAVVREVVHGDEFDVVAFLEQAGGYTTDATEIR